MLRILSTLCLFIILPTQVMAATVSDEDATALKNTLQALLDYQKNTGEALKSVVVNYDGEIAITQESDHYLVTFPRITLKSPEVTDMEGDAATPTRDAALDLGVIKMSAMPNDKAGSWKTIIQFPETMTLSSPNTPEGDFVIHVGEQKTVGILDSHLGYFNKLNMSAKDISFTVNGEKTDIEFGGVQVYQNFDEKGDGYYSGPFAVTLSNITAAPSTSKESFQLSEFKLNGEADMWKLPPIKEYETSLLKLAQALDSTEQNGDSGNPDKIINAFGELYNFDMNGFSFAYSIKDLKVISNDPNKKFDLNNATMGMTFSDMKSDKGGFRITGGHDGLKSAVTDQTQQDMIPDHSKIDITLVNIPYTTLSEMATNSVTAISANPESAQMVGLGLMMKLPAILTQAGTKARVQNTEIGNDVYDVNLDGTVITDLKSVTGFTAKFTSVFTGLDALISAVEQSNTENKSALPQLQSLKAAGEPTTGKGGKPAYSYIFEATPDGQFLLNGKNPQAAMSGAQ